MRFLRESRISYAIVAILVFCLPSMAVAQDIRTFPTSVRISVEGTTYRAFDLGNFRALLAMDADLTAALAELTLRRQQVTELTQVVESTRTAVTALEHSQEVLQAERDRLTLQWQEADEALQNCEHKPRLGPLLAWVSAATLLLVSSVLVTVIVVKN